MRVVTRIAGRGLSLPGKALSWGIGQALHLVGSVLGRGRPEPRPAPRPEPRPGRGDGRGRRSTGAEAARASLAEPPAWSRDDTAAAPPTEPEEHVDEEATLVESFGDPERPGPEIEVGQPWEGYDGMTARDIVARVKRSSGELAAAVRLYEAANKNRVTVLQATERALER